MARFAQTDSEIRANRLILANRFRVPELNPFFANHASRGLKIAKISFEAIRANRSHVTKIGCFFCESIRANLPDSRCESPGHLRFGMESPFKSYGPSSSAFSNVSQALSIWLFAQKPQIVRNHPDLRFSPKTPVWPRNPPGIRTELTLSAMQILNCPEAVHGVYSLGTQHK